MSDQGAGRGRGRRLGAAPAAVVGAVVLSVAAGSVWLYAMPAGRQWRLERASDAALTVRTLTHPGDGLAQRVLGERLLGAHRPDEAAAAFAAAARAEPGAVRPIVLQAHALVRAGRPGEAVAVLEPTRSRSPEDAAIRSALGEAVYASGNPDAAAAHFRAALERKPGDAATWSGLALALSELRQHEAAITAGRRAVARDPRSGETHAALGHALTAAGDAASAVAVLERAVQKDPGSGRAWGLLAAARVRTARSPADFERARTALDQAEALLPGSARVAYTYGLLLSAQRRHEEAVAMFERALRRDPNYTDALYNLGVALAFSGRAAESKAVRLRFEKIRALERDIANLQLRLARDSENRTLWQRMLHLAEARGDRQRAAVARTHLYRGTQR